MAATSSPERRTSGLWHFAICLSVVVIPLLVLFGRALLPDYVVFSNDGPLGGMVSDLNRMPGILAGIWADLNWFGGPYPPPFPDASTALRLITNPLYYAKLFAPFSLFVVGVCAWLCFRQYRFSSLACLLVAAAATLNSDFVGTAAWGVCAQPIAFGMNFLALGALADTTSPRRWLRVVLAGFCVGLGVMEAYDIGALFSLFVAAFVVVQSLVSEGPVVKRLATGIGRLAVVGACAGLIAAAALMTLIGTQVKGVVGMGQDAETKAARWTEATQYSLPKIEALGMVFPGLFGFRSDTPDGGAYWGRGGSHPSWDEYVQSDGQKGSPNGAFSAGAGSNYAGLLVFVVALFGVAQSFRKQGSGFTTSQRRLIWFWCAAFLIALLLMFGRFAPFYQFFYALPYASTIRNPAKFHHIVQWSLLILFAYGAEALCRKGFTATSSSTNGLGAHWKSFWAKASTFDRRWITGSVLAVVACALVWLVYASARPKLEAHLIGMTRLQYLAQGATAEVAANAANATADSARATSRFSVGQVGRTLLFLIPTIGLVAITLSGYFGGRRAPLGGALLLALLLADMLPISREWVVMVNWKEKYESNSVIEFLRTRPHEQRVKLFPLDRLVDMRRVPRELGQSYGFLAQLYGIQWTQHLFPYNNIQCLDVIQEPRVASEKAAYEAVMLAAPLRHWQLSNTRYLLGPTAMLDFLNRQFDTGKSRFSIALQFDPIAKPGTSGQRLEEISTSISTNGQFAVFDFAGALPRAKLYANWKVSTNDPVKLQEWVKGVQARSPKDWGNALAAQTTNDLAILHELADPAFDSAQTVLLAEPLPVAPGTNDNPGEVKFESYAPKHIVLAAKASAPSVLLLNDKFDSNWHVTVDGQPAKLLRCNFIVRGVFLDKAGEHRIEFKYQPSLTGLYVSLTAVVIGLGLLGFVCFMKRDEVAGEASPAPNHPAKK